jgi:iron complex transport system substrate-binding protein
MKDYKITLIAFALYTVLYGCGADPVKHAFPDPESNLLSYARHLHLDNKNGITTIKIIDPWQGADNISMNYHLVQRGAPVPDGIDSNDVIFVPLKQVVCMSVTHAAMISAIGEAESIAGISGSGLLYSDELRRFVLENKVPDVGYEASLNNELIIKIFPELLMIYGISSESAGYMARLKEMGIKILYVADYLEQDPLARAEWIRLFGALYCREHLADSIFKKESDDYKALQQITQNVKSRPKVLLGLPYKDTWYISPGNSYISTMISDAGGDYLWNDTKADESMPTGIENVFLRALKADYWLNPGTATSLEEILSIDNRFEDLKCFTEGKIFNNNKRVNAAGGNDYWETGTVHPHLILSDIAIILHPELFSDDAELFFYRPLYKQH